MTPSVLLQFIVELESGWTFVAFEAFVIRVQLRMFVQIFRSLETLRTRFAFEEVNPFDMVSQFAFVAKPVATVATFVRKTNVSMLLPFMGC